jgi:hypothetical protein
MALEGGGQAGQGIVVGGRQPGDEDGGQEHEDGQAA